MSEEFAYILTTVRNGSIDLYSVKDLGTSKVLIFQQREDAERYVIMLEQSEAYIIGESMSLDVTEIPLADSIDILNEKQKEFIYVNSSELFVPPHDR